MSDQPTYEELVLRCQRLANIIVRNNNANEMLLRAEIKKAKSKAWDEGHDAGYMDGKAVFAEFTDNPYKEQS